MGRATETVNINSNIIGVSSHTPTLTFTPTVLLSLPPLPPQVQAANELAETAGFNPKQVHFVVGDALAPALPDASYDLVIAVESSTYMPDKE